MTNHKYLTQLAGLVLQANQPLRQAESVTPLQGQNQQQSQNDIAACQSQAGASQRQGGRRSSRGVWTATGRSL
jgi:hypothetical protein